MNKSLLLLGVTLLLAGCQGAVQTSNIPNPTQQGYLNSFNQTRASAHTCKDDTRISGNNSGSYGPSATLRWNNRLALAALEHAKDVATHNLTNTNPHLGSDGSNLGDRAAQVSYPFTALGENIAWNLAPNNVDSALLAWLDSDSGHCQALMDSSYVDLGVAEYDGIWVMMMGEPSKF